MNEAISQCIESIDAGSTAYAASKRFGITISTIRYRITRQWTKKAKPGPESVLSSQEEQIGADWISNMQDRGFPVTRRALLLRMKEDFEANPDQVTPFRNNQPGKYHLLCALNL